MDTKAEWSDTPPGQVGPTFVENAIAEDEAAKVPDSSGLSDVVGEIKLHPDDVSLMEQEFLEDQESVSVPIQAAVSIQHGILPTQLPPGHVALDHRVTVPGAQTSGGDVDMPASTSGNNLTSNDLEMTSNDSQPNPTGPSLTSNDPPLVINDLTKPTTILTRSKPSMIVHAKPANMPTLNAPALIGEVSDYAISIPLVAKWKYIPNPTGLVRLPFHGLEHQVRYRLIPQERTNLQMSAHRKDFIIFLNSTICTIQNRL